VEIAGLDEKGKQVKIKADGLFARALQHEIDHLDGVLMLDRMLGEAEVVESESEVEVDSLDQTSTEEGE
jgi:peptide deformylase